MFVFVCGFCFNEIIDVQYKEIFLLFTSLLFICLLIN